MAGELSDSRYKPAVCVHIGQDDCSGRLCFESAGVQAVMVECGSGASFWAALSVSPSLSFQHVVQVNFLAHVELVRAGAAFIATVPAFNVLLRLSVRPGLRVGRGRLSRRGQRLCCPTEARLSSPMSLMASFEHTAWASWTWKIQAVDSGR
jgi:hypothetical protein